MNNFSSEKINQYVTRIMCPGNVYVYLVEGKKDALLIDTGFGVDSLKNYLTSVTKLPYKVVLTHGHLDHAGGAGEFDAVYLNEKDLELAKEHTAIEMRKGVVEDPSLGLTEKDIVPPLSVDAYLALEDEQTFDLGGVTVTALKMPGHTQGSMCILINECRSVLLGDACNSYGYLQLSHSLTVSEYKDSLKAFIKNRDRFDTVWFSHPHNFGESKILDETIEVCEELLSGQRKGISQGPFRDVKEVWLAKPVDEKGRSLDGSTANFLFRQL